MGTPAPVYSPRVGNPCDGLSGLGVLDGDGHALHDDRVQGSDGGGGGLKGTVNAGVVNQGKEGQGVVCPKAKTYRMSQKKRLDIFISLKNPTHLKITHYSTTGHDWQIIVSRHCYSTWTLGGCRLSRDVRGGGGGKGRPAAGGGAEGWCGGGGGGGLGRGREGEGRGRRLPVVQSDLDILLTNTFDTMKLSLIQNKILSITQ